MICLCEVIVPEKLFQDAYPLAQVYRRNKSPDLFRLSLRLQTHEYARCYEKSTNQSYLEPALFLGMVHALASVDAGIIGPGHETMHQRCFLAVKEGDLD